MENFIGTWKMTSNENFDEYIKAVGFPESKQSGAKGTDSYFTVRVNDEELVSMTSYITFRTSDLKFKLDEPFNKTTIDKRETRNVVALEEGKLVQKQSWEDKDTIIEREIAEGKLIMKCMVGDVVAVATYEKE